MISDDTGASTGEQSGPRAYDLQWDGAIRPLPATPETPRAAGRITRNIVTRADGKLVNVARQAGQLFVCVNGCCCGDTEHGAAPARKDLYHAEWTRRRLRNRVHLNEAGCLGPCPLANVAMLLFHGRPTFFHSMNTEHLVIALFDYIEAQVEASAYLPPPAELAPYAFSGFSWDSAAHDLGRPVEVHRVAVEQSGVLLLTQADTDLLALSRAVPLMVAPPGETDFPPVHAYTVNHLTSEADAAAFFESVVPSAEVVVVRLHGGRQSLPGFDSLRRMTEEAGQWFVALPGTEDLDPELMAASNVGVPIAHEVKAYLQYGGVDNYQQMLYFLADHLLTTGYGYLPPIEQPRTGIYHPRIGGHTYEAWTAVADPLRPTVGVLFYRSYLLAGNTAFVDAIVEQGETMGMNVMPVFAYSLKDPESAQGALPGALTFFVDEAGLPRVDVIVNTMSFAMGSASLTPGGEEWSVSVLERLGVPILQAVLTSMSEAQWEQSGAGLQPLDVAMNVAIPELDGRIITVPIAFKQPAAAPAGVRARLLGGEVMHHAARPDRVARVLGIAQRLAVLRRTANTEKRVAVVLTNHNAKASRIANAVGLDSPASLLILLHRLRAAGYTVEDIPADSDALMHLIVDRGHYDRDLLTTEQMRAAMARVAPSVYRGWFESLPASRRGEVTARWGDAPGTYYVDDDGTLTLAGIEFGNVFVAVQPPRGYGMDKTAIMHSPELAPPHPYLALYQWLGRPRATRGDAGWGADAIVHMGKHGSLEWLPGKGVGLSEDCYPDLLLGDLPLVYPFIVDDPGEGAAAKRRAHAVIVDHLPPAMTSAQTYGPLTQIDRLVDEYYLLERTDPSKLPLLQQEIWQVIRDARLDSDLSLLLNADGATANHIHVWDPATHEDGVPYSISDLSASDFRHLVEAIHAYTHELSTAPIRDGLHVLGRILDGSELIEMLAVLTRLPNGSVPSLRDGLARAFGYDPDALADAPGARVEAAHPVLTALTEQPLNAAADVIEALGDLGGRLLRALAERDFAPSAVSAALGLLDGLDGGTGDEVEETLRFVCESLVPGLRQADDELAHILDALAGRYVPSGPSGAPTRGMAHVLPTGRNFYSIDPRVVPSRTAWQTGELLAQGVIDRYVREEGRVPESVGISIWGTSAMRTQGDDVAQVLALMGVRPRWQAESRRVVGLDVIPLDELRRPRVDVVCRISGFFRDAFPHAIDLIDEAVDLVSGLNEPDEMNFVRRNRAAEGARLREQGVEAGEAWARAGYRVFSSPPGTYGAGILQLIDERQWRTDADFAETYVNWGGYAYTRQRYGIDARRDFRTSLGAVQIALKNQDNREHDIFDSDDYLQFHGGMTASVRSITGANPKRYFGDSQDPQRPRVRDLREEALRVFRSRVVNPRWLASIRKHGYKGALEVAATVDYLFGYDATAQVVEDWMYAEVARAYLLEPEMQAFLRASNPWAATDIATRLLEAMDRGLWASPDAALRAAIEDELLAVESDIEGRARP